MVTSEAAAGTRSSALTRSLSIVRMGWCLRSVLRATATMTSLVGVVLLAMALLTPHVVRPLAWLAVGPMVGLLVGSFLAWRSMPTRAELVAFVDRRLGAEDALVAVDELGVEAARPLHEPTRRRADEALARARTGLLWPRLVRSDLWVLAHGVAMIAVAVLLPVVSLPPPTSEQVTGDAREAVTALRRLDARRLEPELQRRVELARREAEAIEASLARGVERREALERTAALANELRAMGDEVRTRAAQAASDAMSDEPALAEAVRRRDLEALARASERAAVRREESDRGRAQSALAEGAAAARRAGDGELAESLEEEGRALAARSDEVAAARELAEAMPELREALGDAIESLAESGDGAAFSRSMAHALAEAWQRLTPDERQRLARAMAASARAASERARRNGDAREGADGSRNSDARSGVAEDHEMNADEIERALREALAATESLGAELGEQGQRAEGGEARGMRRIPVPIPAPGGAGGRRAQGSGSQGSGSQGSASQGSASQGNGSASQGNGSASQGNGSASQSSGSERGAGGGRPPIAGSTGPVEGAAGLARVRPDLRAGAPSSSRTVWVDPRDPSSERMAGAGTDGVEGATGDVGAIEHPPVPEAYREQVRAFFDRATRVEEGGER